MMVCAAAALTPAPVRAAGAPPPSRRFPRAAPAPPAPGRPRSGRARSRRAPWRASGSSRRARAAWREDQQPVLLAPGDGHRAPDLVAPVEALGERLAHRRHEPRRVREVELGGGERLRGGGRHAPGRRCRRGAAPGRAVDDGKPPPQGRHRAAGGEDVAPAPGALGLGPEPGGRDARHRLRPATSAPARARPSRRASCPPRAPSRDPSPSRNSPTAPASASTVGRPGSGAESPKPGRSTATTSRSRLTRARAPAATSATASRSRGSGRAAARCRGGRVRGTSLPKPTRGSISPSGQRRPGVDKVEEANEEPTWRHWRRPKRIERTHGDDRAEPQRQAAPGAREAPPVDALHAAWAPTPTTRSPSSCAARAATSGTSTASATSTASPPCSA